MAAATTNSNTAPRMMLGSPIDVRDPLEEQMGKAYSILQDVIKGLSDRDANDAILKQSHSGMHDDVQIGLLYGILTENTQNIEQTYYKHMLATSRDGNLQVITKIALITHDKWHKLAVISQERLLWLVKQMISSTLIGVEGIVHNLLRQIAGGDLSARNIYLTDSMLDILNENISWIDKQSPSAMFHGMALYTFLRSLSDHIDPQLSQLRNKEAKFCVFLMNNKWNECRVIGRDLVRVLQCVARIPEIDQIWRRILNDPKSLSPNFSGLSQLMSTKTPRRILLLRLTPEMENKLVYLMTKVKFGNHRRYQEWFQKQYLNTPESQSLRPDLVRFICAVFHPTNEQLQSDLLPRWAVMGWLLATTTSSVSAANSKLALFWDWLSYDPNSDNIMNIEPGILVMQNSLKPHIQLTVSLLDFLCRIIPNFYPPLKDHVKDGVMKAISSLMEKRVISHISTLFESAKLDRDLRNLLRETFPKFCVNTAPEPPAMRKKDLLTLEPPPIDLLLPQSQPSPTLKSSEASDSILQQLSTSRKSPVPSEIDSGAFSDEDPPPAKKAKRSDSSAFKPIEPPRPIRRSTSVKDKSKQKVLQDYIDKLPTDMSSLLLSLRDETDSERQCEYVEKILQAYDVIDDDEDVAANTGAALVILFNKYLEVVCLPNDMSDETLEDSILTPLFALYRNVCSLPTDEPSRDDMCFLLHEMHKLEPRIGYSLLYFLKVGKTPDDKMHAYKTMMQMSCDDKEQERTFILDDLTLCLNDDMRMFMYLIPDIYQNFLSLTTSNPDLMLLICSNIDGTQLLELTCQIFQGHMVMFRKETINNVLTKSLEWETIEQYFLWQLLISHDLTAEQVIPILFKLEYPKHAEALTGLMSLLKNKGVSNELIRVTLCRKLSADDMFTAAILKQWASEDEDKTADSINHFVSLSIGTPRKPNKKSKKEMPSIDNILSHLDSMRLKCKNISFLTNDTIQQALQQVQHSSNDSQKQRFSELFALVMDEDEAPSASSSRRNLRQTAARRANNASPKPLGKTRLSDSSDSDEDDVRSQPKKRKRGNPVIELDDSDD